MPTSCALATTNRTGSTEQAAAFFLMERFLVTVCNGKNIFSKKDPAAARKDPFPN